MTVPLRINGQTILASWFNLLRTMIGELATITITVIADHTIDNNANVILIDSTAEAVVVLLPDASLNENRKFTVKFIAGSNAASVASAGGLIDGSATFNFRMQYESVNFLSDGGNWYVV